MPEQPGHRFLVRNRVISALARGTIMVGVNAQIAASTGVALREVLRALPTLEDLGHAVMKDDGR